MHRIDKRILAGLIGISLLSTGCTGTVRFDESNRDPSFNGKLQRIFIISYLDDFHHGFAEAFQEAVGSVFRERGVSADVVTISDLELDSNAILEKITDFRPDAVIVIYQTKGLIGSDGMSHTGWFVVKMYEDIESDNAVWASKFSIVITSLDSTGKTANRLVKSLSDELRCENFL